MIRCIASPSYETYTQLFTELTNNTIILCENDTAFNCVNNMMQLLTDVSCESSTSIDYYSDAEDDLLTLTVDEPLKKVYTFKDIQKITIVTFGICDNLTELFKVLSIVNEMVIPEDLWFVSTDYKTKAVNNPVAFTEYKDYKEMFANGHQYIIDRLSLGVFHIDMPENLWMDK